MSEFRDVRFKVAISDTRQAAGHYEVSLPFSFAGEFPTRLDEQVEWALAAQSRRDNPDDGDGPWAGGQVSVEIALWDRTDRNWIGIGIRSWVGIN